MKVDVKMPKLGESLTEGTILRWLKKVGEPVQKDETLLEVSTDKVDSEIPSPVDGVVAEIVAQENETVEINQVMARIETDGAGETSAEKPAPKEIYQPPAAESKTTEKPAETAAKSDAKEKPEKSVAQPGSGNIIDVEMPKLGESLTEGTILKWWKKPGDAVKKDETLLEVSTDKVDSEIPSPVDGVLKEILAEENETVEIHAVIARMETTAVAASGAGAESTQAAETHRVEKEAASVTQQAQEQVSGEIGRKQDGRFYSPLVRNIAREEGVSVSELAQIPGSGAGGRVSKKDILNYLKSRTAAPTKKVQEMKHPAAAPSVSYDRERELVIPMDAVRKRIAVHMRQSVETSAHVYSVSECDLTAVMNLMHARRPEFEKEEGFKLTVTPFILHAVAKALLDFPRVNCSLQGDNIIEKKYINLGIAVAAPKGLIVPVIKDAEEKSFRGLARSVNDLVQRTRANKLTLDDVQGSTFSITNYGVFGNIIGLPIINQPNVAILGIGAIKKRPVVIESQAGDSIAIRSMVYISMSYDHRVVDGELGGKFMQRLVEYLENVNKKEL